MCFQDQLQDKKKGLTFSKDNKALKKVAQCSFQPRIGVRQVFFPLPFVPPHQNVTIETTPSRSLVLLPQTFFFENLTSLRIPQLLSNPDMTMSILDPNGQIIIFFDVFPSSLLDPSWVQVSQTTKLFGTWGTFTALSTKRGRGAC
jgi:hypothetical protein